MRSSTLLDVAIIGGGVTGAAVAREAARRGLSAALVEKGDFASGTSSKSSKLIHGGQRYLEALRFGLVRESCRERATLSRLAPHLVRPLPFLFPVGERGAPSRAALALGLSLYRLLAGSSSAGPARFLRRSAPLLGSEAPGLAPEGWQGAFRYFDAQADDALLTLAYLRDAAGRGAELRSYCRVEKIEREKGGAAAGLSARDLRTGEPFELRARVVISALGPWSNRTAELVEEDLAPLVRPSRGSHFFLPPGTLPVSAAVVMLDSSARRCYAIPWRGGTLVGTTDADDAAAPEDVVPTNEDRAELLGAIRRSFPGTRFDAAALGAGFAGIRPLAAPPPSRAGSPAGVSREERITEAIPRLLVSVGGKLTTARRTAERVLDRAERILSRDFGRAPRGRLPESPLAGGAIPDPEGFRSEVRRRTFERLHLSEAHADRILEREGAAALESIERMAREPELARPISSFLPYTVSDLVWGIESGLAKTADDLLSRRVRLRWESPAEAAAASSLAEEIGGRFRPKPLGPGVV